MDAALADALDANEEVGPGVGLLGGVAQCVRKGRLRGGPRRARLLGEGRTVWLWSWGDSNPRPPACKAGALPSELQPRVSAAPPLDRAAKPLQQPS